jgi:hypothetical protein
MVPFLDSNFLDSAPRRPADGLLVVALAAGCWLLGAAGCQQAGPSSPVAAGAFFRQIGPVSLVQHEGDGEKPRPAFETTKTIPRSETPKVPDSKIRLDIGMDLAEADIPVSEVDLTVDEQRAMVEGRAGTLRARDRVELLIRSHEAVRGVDNRLQVEQRPAAGERLEDETHDRRE